MLHDLLGPPVQVAYAVPDVDEAVERWERLGAGPFVVRRHIPVTDVVYRGSSAMFDHSSAYGQWGDMMVELVQDHGDGPSVVREIFAPGRSGFHHLAFFVDDLDAATSALAHAGYGEAMRAFAGGRTEFRFIDALATHGHFLELYVPSPHLRKFYAEVASVAAKQR